MRRSQYIAKSLAVLFLAIIWFLSITNLGLLYEPVSDLLNGEMEFAAFTKKVVGLYRDEFNQRETFITLNGGYVRATGARLSNNIIRMNNGHLTETANAADATENAGKLIEFYDYLGSEEISFLYVQTPRKPGSGENLLPVGLTNGNNASADQMVGLLTDAGIPLLDLRPHISATSEQIDKYFYRTDHHWNAEGAFAAFRLIVERIQEMFPDEPILGIETERESWNLNVWKDYFLGSHGRRVGIGFAGLDDLTFLTPQFETSELSRAVPEHKLFRKGDFKEAILDPRFIQSKPDYYNTNPYCITGDDYSHVQYRNANARSNLKVLMIKDSFGIPLEGMFATIFKEFDTLDLRYLRTGNPIEYIRDLDPDIVIVLYNPSFVGGKSQYQFGLNDSVRAPEENPQIYMDSASFNIIKNNANHNHQVICKLRPGTEYTLMIDSIHVTEGNAEGVMLCLYDFEDEKRYDSHVVDLKFEQMYGDIRWTFVTPESPNGELCLIAYAGIAGSTYGNSVEYGGVTVYTGNVRPNMEIQKQ